MKGIGMISIFCMFVGFLLNAFGFNAIENTTAILLAFLSELTFEIASLAIYAIIKSDFEMNKPDGFFEPIY